MRVKIDRCPHFVSPESQRHAFQSDADPWTRFQATDVGQVFQFQRLDVQDVILPAQSRTARPQTEKSEEEFAYVISGRPFLWHNGELYPLRTGDVFGFPAGPSSSHAILNFSADPARLILVREKTRPPSVQDLVISFVGSHSGIPTEDPSPWITTKSSPYILRALDCPIDPPWHYAGSEETFGVGRRLSTPLKLTKLGVWLEILPPGKRSSFPHAHSHEEEIAIILEGSPHLWRQGQIVSLHPRDAAGFEPGTGIAHCLINNDVHPVIYLMIGEAQEIPNEKIHYPLNPVRNMECYRAGHHWYEATRLPVGFAPAVANNSQRDLLELMPTEEEHCFRLTRAGHSFARVTFLGFTNSTSAKERAITVSLSDVSALTSEVRPRLKSLLDDFAARFYQAEPGSWTTSI